MTGLQKRFPIPLYIRICFLIGAFSVIVLPVFLLGAAWHRYKTEEAFLVSQRELSRPKVDLPSPSLPPAP